MELRVFQKRFIRGAFAPGIDCACLSVPRGNGKSWLAGHLLTRCMSPGDPLHQSGAEYLLLAASLEQARIAFRFTRGDLEPCGDFRFIDSVTRLGITHKPSNTKLRVLSSNSKSAFGIVGCPLLLADEPGAWETTGGQLMADAILTAQGKPGSALRVIFIGTLAPATGGWWHDLVAGGTNGTTYVQRLMGDREKWDQFSEIRRCNPLTAISASFRAKLLDERDKARRDSRLKARFLSYRLNVPTADASTMLLTIPDFEAMLSRPVPPREGLPIIGIDLGGSRAWSAALALYRNGRLECRALAPGIPCLADQETRDMVPVRTYSRLADQGVLIQAEGLRIPPAKMLINLIASTWGRPACLILDRFRIAELRDAGVPCRVVSRVTRWSESSYDIRALRSRAIDGPFAVAECSRELLYASLRVATVKNDDSGNFRLEKRGKNNTARDDVAAALTLAAGAFARSAERVQTPGAARHLVV